MKIAPELYHSNRIMWYAIFRNIHSIFMHFACIERKNSHSTRLWNFLPNVRHRFQLCLTNRIMIICMSLEFFPSFSDHKIETIFFIWKHRFKGCGCPIFSYISQKTYKSINTTKDLNYYILVRCEGDSNNFAAPISINKPIIRTAFGLTTPQDANVNIWIAFFFSNEARNLDLENKLK